MYLFGILQVTDFYLVLCLLASLSPCLFLHVYLQKQPDSGSNTKNSDSEDFERGSATY